MAVEYRICTACGGGPWPPQRFYVALTRPDGTKRRMRRCKLCVRKAVKENQEAKAESVKRYKAAWAKTAKAVAARARYRQTERGRQVVSESRKAWKVCHPEEFKASQARWRLKNPRKRAASPPPENDHGIGRESRHQCEGH